MNNPAEELRAAMRRVGLEYSGPLFADGKLHRFKTEGDHNRNSFYVLHADPPAAGMFGCWKRGLKENWCTRNGSEFSNAEWTAIRSLWRDAEQERERTERERQEQAMKTAAWILDRAKPVHSHRYLSTKGVKPFGDLREYRGLLVLPLWDATGVLHSLQFISPNGRKRFLSGGRVQGCFFTVTDKPAGRIAICEGYATAASIHQATGWATVAAMNCGNLKPAAEALRAKWPEREIVIAGDDDQWTEGNPGRRKATDAANTIKAKLVLPQFKNTETKPTDFNDLHQLEGIAIVKAQIELAATPNETPADEGTEQAETDETILRKLATLSPLECDRQLPAAAEKLGVTLATLRSEVSKRRPKASTDQGTELTFPKIELWPDPVYGAEVLDQIALSFVRYVALPGGAADVLALWCSHAHTFHAFTCTPRLNISSPDKGCGKTTLRDVIALFVPRPLLAENLSVAVLFRVIESHKPILLADECDSWLSDNEELRGLLNAGHRRGGQALRCEGEVNEVRAFNVFAPAVLCGIGDLPGTLHDRSMVIRLTRAKPGEVKVRFDSRHTEREHELCRKLARWCADNFDQLAKCDPELPTGVYNRLADNWRPIFAIAQIVGGDWPRRAREAFVKICSSADLEAQGIGTMLLADIAAIFACAGEGKLPSAKIVETLAGFEGKPWAEFGRQRKSITPNQLATQLRRFGVFPGSIKLPDGSSAKGYHLEQFEDAFARFLPQPPFPDRHPGTDSVNTGGLSLSETTPAENGLQSENAIPAPKNGAGAEVTVRKQGVTEDQDILRL